ncbi:MAG: transcription-repair coupling factor [Rikenellaceae bacterium]|jgi:transcription-repair coupling factor (superfamily II helicase)|nr:transcription-repair coupling factor [Rikenellaceae bacterium]
MADAVGTVLSLLSEGGGYGEFSDLYDATHTVEAASLSGSAFAALVALTAREKGGVHVVTSGDRDAAAYLTGDLYALLDPERVMFFPTAYKRSIEYGQEDASGIIQHTAALAQVRNVVAGGVDSPNYLVLSTYPEALAEKVVDREQLGDNTLTLSRGDKLSTEFLKELLSDSGFERVDFVYGPGQFSARGGIVDVFSYSTNRPFRVDFFGDTVDSIRTFDPSTQLSIERLESVEIVPNLKNPEIADRRVSLATFVGERATWWLVEPDHTLKRIDHIRRKLLADSDVPSQVDRRVTSAKAFLDDTLHARIIVKNNNLKGRAAEAKVNFATLPQPSFNKKFELLAEDIAANAERGYATYILSENKAQIERLTNIFHSVGRQGVVFRPLELTLHEGFIATKAKAALYTDHQIFERYHRYRLRGELDKSESLTLSELNTLRTGDYVVHIDHGVGRFGGLVTSFEGGRKQEAIKLEYRDNDVLLVNVHAMHRIARYKDRDSDPPKIYKLGSGAWQKMKASAKRAVKDIARELTALYARRKAAPGFAFAPDGYMQHELESSFEYEDTPDQLKATRAIKNDMESAHPMDRLVCGDVGFGKTEVAIRAAFKAASDPKQVAVLAPTTILALQHYRTFSQRLADFPVKIEMLSRARTAKEGREILAELAAGRIDILIGTHKILGREVKFKDLGLLIIDEEQKFGVGSKEKLRQLSVGVDTLTLTATPIPRTLQFSLMGSRDLSVISTPPPNRQPILTESHTFDEELIREAVDFELARHGQLYFVNNRVEELPRIEQMIRRLCPGVRTAAGHGQMEPAQLERTIMDFIYGEFDVLVATTIIENGIDIPNANTIIINNAHYFGLSDLHQMRGRVGRSNRKGFCYLLTPPDEMLTQDARRRLRALEEFSELGSGFNIAMQDLDIRGAGNLLGAEQSGFIADIGFETYQKILAEAMDELHAEGAEEGAAAPCSVGFAEEAAIPAINYVSDCHIETDAEAYIPDEYVGQSVEKIRLYKELDSLSEEGELQRFASEMVDRFGPLPDEAVELLNIIRLRRLCVRLGFERAKVKNGLMILRFVGDQSSPYYKSRTFMSILEYVSRHGGRYVLKKIGDHTQITVREVSDIAHGLEALKDLL